jgi:cytochrome c biogenesis protein CcdA
MGASTDGASMSLEVLPLAITMMAGPQIMSAIIFVTAEKAVPVSVAFVAGVAIAATVGTAIALGIASLLGDATSLGESSESGSTGSVIQYVLVGLLVLAALKSYLGRETAEPPKMLGRLQEADPTLAFRTGALLILLFPSDVIVLLTVGINLEHSGAGLVDALPFILATTAIAALPLLAYLLFHRRAVTAMPQVRDWMNTHSWVVNIIACAIFIVLILG